MVYNPRIYGGIKGVLLPISRRGALIAIYGAPPSCNYCGKLGQPKTGWAPHDNWKGYHWGGLTLDHIIPRCLDGANEIDNYQILCEECNQAKSRIEQKVYRELGGYG